MSREIAIRVQGLGKRYQLGRRQRSDGSFRYERFSDALVSAVTAPYRWLRARPSRAVTAAEEEFWALRDVSFEVKEGEVLGIIGRNGAGKSTLLKILARITEPTRGSIELGGRVASLLEVGTGFHPELTGRENIYLNGAILGMRHAEIRGKFDEIVAFAEVDRFLDTPVKRYSSGMYVRLAFAVAAHLEPDILVVDEVLAVGDAQFQQKCMGKMGEAAKTGRTVLFVSHNMAAVEALCGRALLLEHGRVVLDGKPPAVVEQYLSRAIKSSQDRLVNRTTRNIRAFTIKNAAGVETEQFGVGEEIVFDVELFHEEFLDRPRFGINIHSPNGERLTTIHTDVHQNRDWSFHGTRRIRAIWSRNRLAPALYRVDVSFWGCTHEIEHLPGVKSLEIVVRDLYGTGVLPDPTYQGHMLAEARWEMDGPAGPRPR
jgi:lipopolysaccharide transport system ATP-binding protein